MTKPNDRAPSSAFSRWMSAVLGKRSQSGPAAHAARKLPPINDVVAKIGRDPAQEP